MMNSRCCTALATGAFCYQLGQHLRVVEVNIRLDYKGYNCQNWH